MKIINLLLYQIRKFLVFLALALQIINRNNSFAVVTIFLIITISIYFFCQKIIDKRSLEEELKNRLKEEERLINIINEKNNLLEQTAYSLRLSIYQRIAELVQDEYPSASFEYQKSESFLIFKDGGRFSINLISCEKCDHAEIIISVNQEVTINFIEKEYLMENFDTNFDFLEDIEYQEEEFIESLEEDSYLEDFLLMDHIDENQDDINQELESWFRDIGKAELENILSKNKKLEVLIDRNGEILSLEKEKLGRISFLPGDDKWKDLKSTISSFGLLVEDIGEHMKIKVS